MMETAQRHTPPASSHRAHQTIVVENPATRELVGTIPTLGREQVQELTAVARAAQPGWEALGFEVVGGCCGARSNGCSITPSR
jgi:acyl-CoA reductase-like NAD-dependent aldehyde dehydrogenase